MRRQMKDEVIIEARKKQNMKVIRLLISLSVPAK